MEAFELKATLTLDTSGFDSALGSVEGSLTAGKGAAGFTAWGTMAGNLAAQAFSKALSAGVQFARDTINKTMDFESAMDYVQSVTQSSEHGMEQLTAKARELGGSTVFTAEQVAEAMFYMGQAGWNTEQILAGIPAVMDLAAASGDDLSRVSDIVTDSITNFGLTAEETGHYVDVLAQTARNSNTSVSMMGEAFKYVSPVAKSLNYSIEDIGLALGLAANNGIKASQAGTSLRMILSTLINPSDAAAKAMDKWGITLDDGTGKIKPFADVMADFRRAVQESGFDPSKGRSIEEIAAAEEKYATAVEQANTALKNGSINEKQHAQQVGDALTEYEQFTHFNREFLSDISDIAGLRGLSTLLAIMNTAEKEYAEVQKQIQESEGAANEMAETRRDNLKGDVTLFKSAVDDLQLAMGDTINEHARGFVQTGTEMVKALTNLVTGTVPGQGKLNADQMIRVMDKYEEWNKTSNWQFITKSNKAAELYRTVADELEAAGASEQEIVSFVDAMMEVGNGDQLAGLLSSLASAEAQVGALGDAADGVAGDYDMNFHINTIGSMPSPASFSGGTGGGGAGKFGYISLNAKGDWNVPYDNYLASLHRGEMVLTATQARQYREGGDSAPAVDPAAIASAVRSAILGFTMELNGEAVGRVFGDQTTRRVNDNISQINRRHRYGYGG